MSIVAASLLGLSATFSGAAIFGRSDVALASSPHAKTVIAKATVSVLDRRGHHLSRARARSTVVLEIQSSLPRTFPRAYTDVRFKVVVRGRAERTIIDGSAEPVHPGESVRVTLATPVSPTWIGFIKVVGTIRLLYKPGGASTGFEARGVAKFHVDQ